jgi:hypothetical protein
MVFSQEITIPFRDGKLWGLCDEEGKIIIEPRFDKLSFSNQYDDNQKVLIPVVRGKEGLIIEGKMVFEPIYEHIYEKNHLYYTSRYEKGSKISDVVDVTGKSIMSGPIIDVLSNKNITDRFCVFHVLNNDFTETFFIYDTEQKKILQTLYEKYYSISIIDKQSDYSSVSFLVKKQANDPLIAEAWDVSALQKGVIKKAKLLYRTEQDYRERFAKSAQKEVDENQYEKGYMGYGTGGVGRDSEMIMRDDNVVVEPGESSSRNSSKNVYLSQFFKLKENVLTACKTDQGDYKKNTEQSLNLKIPAKDIDIKNYAYSTKRNDTLFYYSNFIQFKKNEKMGLLFFPNIDKTIEFDTISPTINSLSDLNYSERTLVLCVGNKEKKTQQMKYTLYSNSKGFLFPMEFDALTPTKWYSTNANKCFITKKGDKYGMIQVDGTEFLKTDYDAITEVNDTYEYNQKTKKLLEIRKAGKRGVVYQDNANYMIYFIPPLFEYDIRKIKPFYPKSNVQNAKKITLLSLYNDQGEFVGYANEKGLLYFKN